MKIVEYQILTDNDPACLSLQVKSLIKRGWQPWGGLVINSEKGDDLVQAMVRYEEEAK